MVRRIAHIAVATDSIAVTSQFYKSLGLELERVELVPDQKVRVAVMRIGDSAIEFIEPAEADSPIQGFLSRHGSGLHHISLEVEDLATRLKDLKARNVRLIDARPRLGAEGRLIAFIHPDSTGGVLVELSQKAEKDL